MLKITLNAFAICIGMIVIIGGTLFALEFLTETVASITERNPERQIFALEKRVVVLEKLVESLALNMLLRQDN